MTTQLICFSAAALLFGVGVFLLVTVDLSDKPFGTWALTRLAGAGCIVTAGMNLGLALPGAWL